MRALEKVWWNKRRGDDGEMGVKEEANDREVTNELERDGVSVWVRIIRETGEVEYEWKNQFQGLKNREEETREAVSGNV